MKHIVTILLAASIGACSMVVIAEQNNLSHFQEYGDTLSHFLLGQENVILGKVVETKKGVAIATADRTLLLKGVARQDLVGELVKVAGVIRGESIFAVKILSP
jgi:hypothetical protein